MLLENNYTNLIIVRELIYHARYELKQVSLEIGGSLPNELLFDHIGIESYGNIESPTTLNPNTAQCIAQGMEIMRGNKRSCNAEYQHESQARIDR